MTVNSTSEAAGVLDNMSEIKKKHPHEKLNGNDKENYDAEQEKPTKRLRSHNDSPKDGELEENTSIDNQGNIAKAENAKEFDKKKKEAERAALRQKKLEEKEEAKRQRELEREEEKKRKEAEKEREKKRKEEEKEEEKRRKEIARREKEVKKEEERKKKEELRLQKEEEKRRRDEEKEEEKRVKEEEKRAKEAEKLKKEEEKKKKKELLQKSQMNLSSFFAIQNAKDASKGKEEEVKADKHDVSSSESTSAGGTERFYDSYFLPFHLRKDVTVGSCNYLTKQHDNGDCLSWLKSHNVSRGGPPRTTIPSIISLMNDGTLSESNLAEKLKAVPMKFLSFEENIRPPYYGTFSKYCERVACHPFEVISDDINYDYESDLEWINYEDDEGEDIGDEDSDDGMDDDDEDMDEFLDTEADGVAERATIMGPLEASVKFNDSENQSTFKEMAVQFLFPCNETSIDPFKDYWAPKTTPLGLKKESIKPSSVAAKDSAKPVKTVPEDKLSDVLSRVNQSDMSLILLVEIIKRDIPALTKESIRNTIKASAVQQGQKERKRWVINPEFHKYIA